MIKQLYFPIILCIVMMSYYSIGQTDPNQPNILIIIADDLGIDYSNGYQNNPLMPTTPHLDNLRATGLTFQNAWAAPQCTPTRAGILSGKYGVKNDVPGVPGNLDLVHESLFDAVANQTNNAYADALFGKWHISSPTDPNHPSAHGVDHFEGFMSSNVDDYYAWEKTTNGQTSSVNEYLTAHITTAAINWINGRNTPWLAILSHGAPHSPFHIPPSGTYTQAPTNSNKQKFTAAIESMDYEIGRLTNSIPSAVLNNTLIIFLGDNGSPPGVSQYYLSNQTKGTVYQGGANVPFIVNGIGVTRTNELEPNLVHAIDIYATVLETTGATLEGGIYNSQSFNALLTDSNLTTRPYNFTSIDSDWAIRNTNYKLINREECIEEFYDMTVDELEENNLINSLTPEQELIYAELKHEASVIISSWSCNDLIQNGNETGIDCGGGCKPCTGTISSNCKEDTLIICNAIAIDSFAYSESVLEAGFEVSSNEAIFQAGDCISLEPGFEFSGGTFEASIEDCLLTGIDDIDCPNSNATSQVNIGCCLTPTSPSVYIETASGDIRTISTNNFPNHDYCYANNNNIPSPTDMTFTIDLTPSLHCANTSILTTTNTPLYLYGVALNGVLFAPAPATPFIFTNTITGEYNWDWVFEPTNNQGSGPDLVGLDCASAHTGPQGYHYHGNMFQYIEEVVAPGLSTTDTPPNDPVQVGWAADGYPIVYRFGPDANGDMTLLKPSFQLKYGNRPGDGISEPCGSYNGKYTNDYRYVDCSGDLDECNGIQRSITLTTAQGIETFDYFYVVTAEFPQIGRCFSGIPDESFR